MFFVYSATVGITFAFIFELYTTESIFTAFFVTAGMFGALAVLGAITDIDLSKLGSIAFMALIGLILATIVNIFWANETLYWVTTYAGRSHLRRADRLRHAEDHAALEPPGLEGEAEGRAAIIGALSLYLDFINLFLFLLRIFGRSAVSRGRVSGEPSRGPTGGRAAGGAWAPRTCSPTTTTSGAGAARRGRAVRAADAGGVPVRALLADDPAQARRTSGGLRRIRRRAGRRPTDGRCRRY